MRKHVGYVALFSSLFYPLIVSAQSAQEFRTLAVNDRSGKAAILEMGGKSYIDLNQLAQIAHGSISYEGNQIKLSVPCTSANPADKPAEAEPPASQALSHEFMKAGIEEISIMREWASSLASVLQNGYPVTDSWISDFKAKAQAGLATASAAASTDADRDAFQQLRFEFDAVQKWSNKLVDARKSMNAAKYALSPDALRNDPLSQKIISCAHGLGQMLASGALQDNPSCH